MSNYDTKATSKIGRALVTLKLVLLLAVPLSLAAGIAGWYLSFPAGWRTWTPIYAEASVRTLSPGRFDSMGVLLSGQHYNLSAREVIKKTETGFKERLNYISLGATAAGVLFSIGIVLLLHRDPGSEEKQKRGGQLVDASELAGMTRKQDKSFLFWRQK